MKQEIDYVIVVRKKVHSRHLIPIVSVLEDVVPESQLHRIDRTSLEAFPSGFLRNMLSSWMAKKSQNMIIWESHNEIFVFFSHFLNIVFYKMIQDSIVT